MEGYLANLGFLKRFNKVAPEPVKSVETADMSVQTDNMQVHYGIYVNDKKKVYILDIPGMTQNDINIKLDKEKRIMAITGERKDTAENPIYLESTLVFSSFEKVFEIDENLDITSTAAFVNDGVLRIEISRN